MTSTINGEPKPNSHFQNLYYVENAKGSSLTYGLRSFNRFFETKCIELEIQNKKCSATILKIVKIMLDILVYPILGALALIGVYINEYHLNFHNSDFELLGSEAIGKSQKLIHVSPRFSQTDNIKTTNFEESTRGTDLSNFFALQKILSGIVNTATSNGLFIAKLEMDALKEKAVIFDSFMRPLRVCELELNLNISLHQPENQDSRRLSIEAVKEAKKSGSATLNQLQDMLQKIK
jgi:hypothetical protein